MDAMATLVTANMEVLVAFTCLLLFLFHWRWNKNSAIANWPILGMLPGLLLNLRRMNEYLTTALKASGGTLVFKGPWFLNMDLVLTSDPANINHILSKRFSNYTKGPDFKDTFEPLGDGFTAVDSDLWAFQRKMIHQYLKDDKFQLFLERTVREKVVKSLYPILDHLCSQETEVNMADVILRLGFDVACSLILGCDSQCLSLESPQVAHERAMNEVEEVLLYRNVVPGKYWRLMRFFQLGVEKKLGASLKIFDRFAYQCIESKRAQLLSNQVDKEGNCDFVTTYLLNESEYKGSVPTNASNPNKFLRDMASSLLGAGRDTSSAALCWFFWLLAKNPYVEDKILEEINERLDLHIREEEGDESRGIFSMEELNKLVYLHATLCETLRLYPSIPFNLRVAVEQENLPSGLKVDANKKIFLSFFAMGRMEDIWGRDCLEFKPERWISDKGDIVHVPSYKFSAFNAGPRSCLGKDMSFVQMKTIAVAILVKYRIKLVEDHPVEPGNSIVLYMKHGMKVRITKRGLS